MGPRQYGGQNKGLSIAQEKVVDDFIRKQLEHNFLPLRPVIFSAITNIRARGGKGPLSNVWFGEWWRKRGLHKIKTKPIAIIRTTAQDEKEVNEWYEKKEGYFDTLAKYQIKDTNIYNFDETNARLGCLKGMDVIVPEEVKELYSLSPENCKSVTVIEAIGVMNVKKIPPVIIVPCVMHMESWYRNQTPILYEEDRPVTALSPRLYPVQVVEENWIDILGLYKWEIRQRSRLVLGEGVGDNYNENV